MDDPVSKLKIMSENLDIYLNGMHRAAPLLKSGTWDEDTARVTISRMLWHDLMFFIRDCKQVVDAVRDDMQPPAPAECDGEKVISLNHERQKRIEKQNERMKPL